MRKKDCNILQTVDTKMPLAMAVKTRSLHSHDRLWAQVGISRCNSSGVECSVALVKGRARVSRVIEESGVTVDGPPIPFSPFSLADCTLLNHFSFNDFVAVAFPDIAGDLNVQI